MDLFEEFVLGYCECILWAETDELDEPLDKNYNIDSFTMQAMASIRADCKKFMEEQAVFLEASEETDYGRHGHSFWLNQNDHGTGFWDQNYNRVAADGRTVGEVLSDACDGYRQVHVYVDEGKIHLE